MRKNYFSYGKFYVFTSIGPHLHIGVPLNGGFDYFSFDFGTDPSVIIIPLTVAVGKGKQA